MYTNDIRESSKSWRDSSGPVSNNLQVRYGRKLALFTEREHLWQNGVMKLDACRGAFEGLESRSRFSYKKQLREATDAVRGELDKAVYLYVSRFPSTGYRALARQLHISTGKLSEILRKFPHGRKRGRRKVRRTAQPNRAVPALPIVDPALGMSVPVSGNLGREGVEEALSVLHSCVLNGRTDDSGEDAYQNLTHWLKKQQGSKTLRQRAGYLTQRYAGLRSRKNLK